MLAEQQRLEKRLQELEKENRLLKEQAQQSERVRRMWKNSTFQLKQAREELLQTQEQLKQRVQQLAEAKDYVEKIAYSDKQVIEHMQEGLIVTDAQGYILQVNPAFTQTTGYAADEVINKTPGFLKSGRHEKSFYKNMWDQLLETGRWQGEVWNRRKNGEIYPELLSLTTIKDWQGDIINYIGVFYELTERKKIEDALKESESRYLGILNSAYEFIGLLEPDGTLLNVNNAALALIHANKADVLGKPFWETQWWIHDSKSQKLIHDAIQKSAKGEFVRFEVAMPDYDHEIHYVDFSISPIIDEEGNVALLVPEGRDITAIRQAEDDVRKLSRAVEHSPVMVIITDQHGTIEYVNPRFSEITGYTADEVIGKHTRVLQSGHTEISTYQDLWSSINAGENWRGEFQNRKKSGELYWQQISISPIFDNNSHITHFVAIEEDITQRKKTEEKIWRQANYDILTGLPNRRLFSDRLHQFIAHAVRYDHQGGLMFIDLDKFKHINDTYGHEAGDLLLKQVAQRITSCTRESDTVARLSGDEFTVILPEVSSITAIEHVAESILQQLSAPFVIKDQHMEISASIGIALFPTHGKSLDEVLKNADTAMYQAKKDGKATIRFFENINETKQNPDTLRDT